MRTARPPDKYGLISGLRRLTACRALGMTTIPAFLRNRQSIAHALSAMVTETETHAPVSPYEKAAPILNTVYKGHFDTQREPTTPTARSPRRSGFSPAPATAPIPNRGLEPHKRPRIKSGAAQPPPPLALASTGHGRPDPPDSDAHFSL